MKGGLKLRFKIFSLHKKMMSFTDDKKRSLNNLVAKFLEKRVMLQ